MATKTLEEHKEIVNRVESVKKDHPEMGYAQACKAAKIKKHIYDYSKEVVNAGGSLPRNKKKSRDKNPAPTLKTFSVPIVPSVPEPEKPKPQKPADKSKTKSAMILFENDADMGRFLNSFFKGEP